jgi:uncharacterized protein with NRDE domain
MCTVTFIPYRENYFITSNRDESPGRRARGLHSFHPPGKQAIHFPLDEISGGSWIALSDAGRVACLLNGGFESFIPQPSYRQSRGLVVTDAVTHDNIISFLENYELNDIAPFTLLIFENDRLDELVWDGEKKHHSILPASETRIWSSATLYTPEIRAHRKKLFEDWTRSTEYYDRESIMSFHQMANGDPLNDFVMNRDGKVSTLSITSVVLKPVSASIMHQDIGANKCEEIHVRYGS